MLLPCTYHEFDGFVGQTFNFTIQLQSRQAAEQYLSIADGPSFVSFRIGSSKILSVACGCGTGKRLVLCKRAGAGSVVAPDSLILTAQLGTFRLTFEDIVLKQSTEPVLRSPCGCGLCLGRSLPFFSGELSPPSSQKP